MSDTTALQPIDTTLLFNDLNPINDSSVQILAEQLCTALKIVDFNQIVTLGVRGIMTDLERLSYTDQGGWGTGPIWMKFRNEVMRHVGMGLIPTGILLK